MQDVKQHDAALRRHGSAHLGEDSLMAAPSYILVAEDDPINQTVMRAMLAAFGYDFEIAENGVEAVEQAIKRKPGLILMDISMPMKNGIEAALEIYKHLGVENLSIIAVTANDTRQQRDECVGGGFCREAQRC